MRKFAIENGIGERKTLTDFSEQFLTVPTGLGFKNKNKYASAEPGFFIATAKDEEQGQIGGTLTFIGTNVYEKYREIADWLLNNNGLKLVYSPFGEKEYYRDIIIDAISKGERTSFSLLETPVTITPLTPWYDKYRLTFEFAAPTDDNYKTYTFVYPYIYAPSAQPNSKDFEIDGHYPGEVELRANGPLTSPRLTLKNTFTEEIYGELDLSNVSILTGQTLYFSSRVNSSGVWRLVEGEDPENLVDQMELTRHPSFFRVPPNTLVTMTLTVATAIESQSIVDIYRYRKAV